MKQSKKLQTSLLYTGTSLLVVYFLICMITNPSKYISKSLDGISAWAFNVLPSVLPFMFFTKVLSSLDVISKYTQPLAPLSTKLFKTSPVSIYVFIMAILSGYPVGSKMVADLYLQGKISRQDAFKMTSFCSTSGPMFIVGAVGVGMFHNVHIGYILFLSHLIGAVLNGIAWRNLKIKSDDTFEPASNTQNSPSDISDIVLNSTLSILSVGCIITIFFIIIETFSPIFSLLPQNISFLFEGFIEITKGCIDLSTLPNTTFAVVSTSFVISFGGVSTLLQSLTMISKLKMPAHTFALQKLSHAIFACLTTILLLFVF